MDLSKHYINEIDALVSLDTARCLALEKHTRKQLHSSSKIVSLWDSNVKKQILAPDLSTRCGPVCLRTVTRSYTLTCPMT